MHFETSEGEEVYDGKIISVKSIEAGSFHTKRDGESGVGLKVLGAKEESIMLIFSNEDFLMMVDSLSQLMSKFEPILYGGKYSVVKVD